MSDQLSSSAIAQDLLHIHDDRIKAYKLALHKIKNLELDEKTVFERMIEESIQFGEQLTERVAEVTYVEGKIYKTWSGLKYPLSNGNKKAILAGCADDELALINAYSIALSFTSLDPELKNLLMEQEQRTKKLYHHIKEFHDAQ